MKRENTNKSGITENYTALNKSIFKYFSYSKDNFSSGILSELNTKHREINENFTNWVNVIGLKEVEKISDFCRDNDIHSLSIQDILDINQRSKSQKFDDYLFLLIKHHRLEEYQLITEQISLVIKKNYLISFQESQAEIFIPIIERLKEGEKLLREKSVYYLLYSIIELILNDYLMTINQIETNINEIDFHLNRDPSSKNLEQLEEYKKYIYLIEKSVLPIRDFSLKLERKEINLSDDLYNYFYEIYDLCLTIIDESDIINSLIESKINLFFSIQGQRMNQIMKTLTVVATIFIPLTFIAGIYGMNFKYMPELSIKYGYLGAWLIFLIIAILMLIYFRKKGYF